MTPIAAEMTSFATAQREGEKKLKLPAGRFVGADLSSSDLHGLTIRGKARRPISFDEALFDNADLKDATFENVNFIGASFKGADLIRTKFINCMLVGADFTDAKVGALFENCQLGKAKFPQKIFSNFTNCHLVGVDLSHRDLKISVFVECALWGADFSNSDLRSTRFENCDSGANKFWTPNFTGANLRLAMMTLMNPLPLGMNSLTLGGVSYALVRSASGAIHIWSETTESWNTLEIIEPTLPGGAIAILTLMAAE